MTLIHILTVLILLLQSATFTAKVVGITDGDSITVLTDDKKQAIIRLEGIDCPESNQAFGSRAKQATSDLCFGKQVKIVKSGEDRYGRTLAFVYVDDLCVNEELLRLGMAWHYKYFNSDSKLAALETEARQSKRGLWSDPNPTPPWDFRRN